MLKFCDPDKVIIKYLAFFNDNNKFYSENAITISTTNCSNNRRKNHELGSNGVQIKHDYILSHSFIQKKKSLSLEINKVVKTIALIEVLN